MSEIQILTRLETKVDELIKKVNYLIDLYQEDECLSEELMEESESEPDSPLTERKKPYVKYGQRKGPQ